MASETELVTKAAVNKILYDGYQQHLHDCANSVRAAQFIHGLQKAVTALPASPSDVEQLMELRRVIQAEIHRQCAHCKNGLSWTEDGRAHYGYEHQGVVGIVTCSSSPALRAALNPDLPKETR